jgi:imidazolonepropionase-like amidohydrolase
MRFRVLEVTGLFLVLVSMLCSAEVMAGAPTPFAPSGVRVVYRGVTLVDGTGQMPRSGMDVVVAGDRIEQVVPDRELDPSILAKARVVDLRGKYLMPGLIDSHVHLATPPNRRQAEAILRRDLYGGVTAVRDMADDLRALGDLARASLVGEIAGSDIYYAALMAGPSFFTDPRTAQVSAGKVAGQVPWMKAITDTTDLPLAVAEARGTSATAIKLYADLTAGQARKITAEAHRQHLLVWAHATLYPARPSEVVAAGVDAISHACLVAREVQEHVPGWTEPHPPVSRDAFKTSSNPTLVPLFEAMVRQGTILDATVWTYAPAASTSTTSPPLQPGGCDDVLGGAVTRQAFLAGVQVSAGTDAVAPWTDRWPDLFHELDALATRAGMSPADVIHAATVVSARAAGQERDMGSIEAGKLANMVILARNPVDDLANLRSVVMTVKRGRIFKRRGFVPLTAGDVTDL